MRVHCEVVTVVGWQKLELFSRDGGRTILCGTSLDGRAAESEVFVEFVFFDLFFLNRNGVINSDDYSSIHPRKL